MRNSVLLVHCFIRLSVFVSQNIKLFIKLVGKHNYFFINCACISFRISTKSMQTKERQVAEEDKLGVDSRLFPYILISLLHSMK
jgi:hypothetical protein